MSQVKHLQQAVLDAGQSGRSLQIGGRGSKAPWTASVGGELLVTSELSGIVAYDPAELFVTAQAGTALRDIELALKQHQQVLACDPPRYRGDGTIGGAVAAGFSGPGRPWRGAVRDAVLGAQIVNGAGELLRFGGQVMKNVAGYDVSRLMAGAWGALGVITEVSIRVAPAPQASQTRCLELPADGAVDLCRKLAACNLPLDGTWWVGNKLFVRLSGTAAALADAADQVGGSEVEGEHVWSQVRDHAHEFFRPESAHTERRRLWRLVVPAGAALPEAADGSMALEWGGGLRWWWHDDEETVAQYVNAQGGWAWAVGEDLELPDAQRRLMRQIREAFDPHSIWRSPLHLEEPAHAD